MDMVIVQLTGGLGNQLFQYAAARSLSLHHNVPLLLDSSSFYRKEIAELEVPRDFELYQFEGVNEKIITPEELAATIDLKNERSFFTRILPQYKRQIYNCPFFHFDPNFFKSRKTVYLKGGWQSEKYFRPFKDTIFQSLQLKPAVINPVAGKAREIKEKPTVGVHIRRGDYLRMQIIFEWHGVMSKEYYARGFETIQKEKGDFSVLYFTDDPEWVQKELMPVMKGEIVSSTISQNHFQDFHLLSSCHHNIIANSSFSWWAAWLNPNPGKMIVAPKNWFNKGPRDTQDLLPHNWIRL
jgi:hypothetical protein